MRNLIFAATSAAALTLLYCLSPQPAQADDMLAPFKRSDEKWGFVNSDQCWVIDPQFGMALPFSEGLARVQLGNKYGFIDRSGQMVINPQFDYASSFSEGLAKVKLGDTERLKHYHQINKQGQILLDPTCVARP